MNESSSKQFGILIGYVLPGFILLVGLAPVFPTLAQWLRPVNEGDLGLGPPIYAVLGATAVGLILSCFRWVLIDHVHLWTGVTPPSWDDGRLNGQLSGFDYLVQNHFRYYEFTANSLLATIGAYGLNRFLNTSPFLGLGTDLGMVLLCAVLFAASRDALAKYYGRTGRLIGRIAEKEFRGDSMFNGNDHGGPVKSPTAPKSEPVPVVDKPSTPEKPTSTGGATAGTNNVAGKAFESGNGN